MAKIFYARVSTAEQNEARQMSMAADQGVSSKFIYLDKMSGKNTNRPQLQKMLDFIREEDVVIVESFSRLARNTRDLLEIVDIIKSKGAELKSLKENLDTATDEGKFMLTVFGAMAELERGTILQRQREGIEEAKAEDARLKAKGKKAVHYTGRQPISTDEQKMKAVCKLWRAGEITAVEAQKRLDLKPNTFYRRVKELGL